MKEFSIITCSKDDARFANIERLYTHAFAGCDYEIIRINDATSLCEGYIRGVHQSSGDTLVFTHDDAAPLRPIAAKLRNHLRRVDIVGGCGTNRLCGPVWLSSGPPHVFGMVLNQGGIPIIGEDGQPQKSSTGQLLAQPGFNLSVFGVPSPLVEGIQAFDGFWFAANRSVVNPSKAWFDPKTFDGFHLYDLDFSFNAYRRGLRIGVACDLNLCHASTGGYGDPKWKPAADRFMSKWKLKLAEPRPRQVSMTGVALTDLNEAIGIMDEFIEQSR